MSVGSKKEERSSPKQSEVDKLVLWIVWVLVKIIMVLGNKYWLWLKKKKA